MLSHIQMYLFIAVKKKANIWAPEFGEIYMQWRSLTWTSNLLREAAHFMPELRCQIEIPYLSTTLFCQAWLKISPYVRKKSCSRFVHHRSTFVFPFLNTPDTAHGECDNYVLIASPELKGTFERPSDPKRSDLRQIVHSVKKKEKMHIESKKSMRLKRSWLRY